MVKFNDREQELLLLLSKHQDYVTSQDLLEALNVSQKTVYRMIKKINDGFKDDPLILSERGRGYKLDYEKFINYQKSHNLNKESYVSPKERRKRIMEELLLSSPKPINIYNLYSEYYVGDSVIVKDEQILSEELKKYNLVLERKNRTLSIIGVEVDIRRAIKDTIEIFKTIDIDDLKKNDELRFNKYDVLFILDQLRKIEEKLGITIPYPYNVNIFSHLYILLSRMRKVPALKVTNNISDADMKNMEQDFAFYEAAKDTVNRIERYLNMSLPDVEIYFLYQYLVSSRLQGSSHYNSTFTPEVIEVTQAYIDGMSEILGINIESGSIFNDLAKHIKPLLNRLKHNIRVHNSLLNQIKFTYEDVFSSVKKVSEDVSERFNLPTISDDENGYITLYFAKVFILGEHQRPIKTIIMCTTGIGTSELLKAKISKKFPELEIVDVLSSQDTKLIERDYSDVELVLSTVHLKETIPFRYLLVSALFTNDDQIRLQKVIEEVYYERG